MGHLAGSRVGVCVLTITGASAAAAPGPATAAFPPAKSAAAAASGSPAALPPPPPPPPPPSAAATPPGAPAPAAAPPAPATASGPTAPAAAAAPPLGPPPAPPPAASASPYPGYGGYPPPGYGYYYPVQAPRVKAHFPENAAASSVPFVDALVTSVSWQNRVSQFLDVGLQGGTYVAGRVRLTANILFPTSPLTDDYNSSAYAPPGSYVSRSSKAASLFYGVNVGIVAVSTPTFVMSPGLQFSRTDVSDYGSSLAFSLPFDWVTGDGLRIGLEADAGRAFGGSIHLACVSNSGPPGTSCGPTITHDRPVGTSIVLQFELGFGFNHPDPLPARSAPEAAPGGWPAVSAPPLAPAAAPAQPSPSGAPVLAPAPPAPAP